MPPRSPEPKSVQMTIPELPGEIQTLSRFERLEELRESVGLVPVSAAELTEIMSIRSFSNTQGGAAGHIAEVVKHQKVANTTDMHRGPRKIIQLWGDWALDATENRDALGELFGLLKQDVNPTLTLDRVLKPTDVGITEFLRHRHLDEFIDTGFIKGFGFDPLKVAYKSSNPGLVPYIEEALSRWKVLDVIKKLPSDIRSEQARVDFHHTSLLQVEKRYPYLRKTAQQSMGKFVVSSAVE